MKETERDKQEKEREKLVRTTYDIILKFVCSIIASMTGLGMLFFYILCTGETWTAIIIGLFTSAITQGILLSTK